MSTLNPLPTPSAAFMADLTQYLREEDADRHMMGWQSFVVTGGLHGPAAGLTATPAPLTAFPNGVYITETAGLTYVDGVTSWVIADALIAGNLGPYIRVPGTHYLVAVGPVQPTVPVEAVALMRVTTAGGAVTEVKDLRLLSPNRGIHTPGIAFSSAYPTLQAAIDALPDTGGTLFITPGVYTLTQTLHIGNGGAAAVSTRQGIQIVGLGAPYGAGLGYTEPSAVKLVWAGGAQPVISVAGPLAGWGIRGLAIDGAGVASVGVYVVSAQYGTLSDVFITGCQTGGLICSTVTTFEGAANTSVLHNRFSNLFIVASGLTGIYLTANATAALTEYNTFDNVLISVTGNGVGLQLGACYANVFTNLHISTDEGALAPIQFAYDNGQADTLPAANVFFGLEPYTKPLIQSGATGPGMAANMIAWMSSGAGGVTPVPDVEGLVTTFTDADGNLQLLPAYNRASTGKTHGDVVVASTLGTVDHIHHLVPGQDQRQDLGASAYRWRTAWIAGGVVTNALILTTGPHTLGLTHGTVAVDASAGPIALTLPPAADASGKTYVIKKLDASANAVTVTPQAGEGIDAVGTPMALTVQWQTRTLQSYGLGWFRLDRP